MEQLLHFSIVHYQSIPVPDKHSSKSTLTIFMHHSFLSLGIYERAFSNETNSLSSGRNS